MSLITDNALAGHPLDPAPAERVMFAGATAIPTHIHDSQAARQKPVTPESQVKVALSKREHQIIDCLVCGLPNKSIARELNITEATVKVYVKGLLRKIKVSNRTQVAIWALQQPRPMNGERAIPSVEALGGPVELHGQPVAPASFAG
jgi:two-component system, NarL family, nitrate/nitrite response regulator NarL